MLEGLEGDSQEKEKKTYQVKGSACVRAQKCETDATPWSMAGSSSGWSKDLGGAHEKYFGK